MLLIITESHIRILLPSGLMKNMHDFFNNNRTFSLIILVEIYLIKYFFFRFLLGEMAHCCPCLTSSQQTFVTVHNPIVFSIQNIKVHGIFLVNIMVPPYIFPKWFYFLKRGHKKRPKTGGCSKTQTDLGVCWDIFVKLTTIFSVVTKTIA